MWMIKVKHEDGKTNLLIHIKPFATRKWARMHINLRQRPRFKGGSVTAIWPVKVKVKYTEI